MIINDINDIKDIYDGEIRAFHEKAESKKMNGGEECRRWKKRGGAEDWKDVINWSSLGTQNEIKEKKKEKRKYTY